ncbi:hypothetical protein NDU88_004963 [Pleurodeles waltl]|uniref:Uncharacterized protein n=1 Tax=Pleurodeles waltl TaxID=8319 RepID=A0AAV7VIH3_PLEWA|nr:hypothetical protein NDU88_004963 [Pleurodeles waltl]
MLGLQARVYTHVSSPRQRRRVNTPECYCKLRAGNRDSRGKSLAKTYGIWKKLDRELAQQQDALNALQRQIDDGDVLENESRVVCDRICALWSRLDSYVRKDFRQRLHREGDRCGRLLAWLLCCEHSTPVILSLRGPTGDRILGQTCVNASLREHLEAIYSSPQCDASSQTQEYLDGLQLPRLIGAQAVELEAELSLKELQGDLATRSSVVASRPTGAHVWRLNGKGAARSVDYLLKEAAVGGVSRVSRCRRGVDMAFPDQVEAIFVLDV